MSTERSQKSTKSSARLMQCRSNIGHGRLRWWIFWQLVTANLWRLGVRRIFGFLP